MEKYADYIKEIEIDSLWSGTRHIVWRLHKQVNVLSGVNGMGKSTILNRVVKCLPKGGDANQCHVKGVHITMEPEDATCVRYDIIRSYMPCKVALPMRHVWRKRTTSPSACFKT